MTERRSALSLTLRKLSVLDLNYLLSRHQVSLMRAQAATTPEARYSHAGLATHYADAIRSMQTVLGATASLAEAR